MEKLRYKYFLWKKIYILFIISFFLFSCKREYELGYYGEEFVPAPEGFLAYGFSASPNPVNFKTGVLNFSAAFSHRVSFVITLKGLSSTATKKINGVGMDPSGVTWDGTHDGLYFFRAGEMVEATLSFFGSSLTLKDTISIAANGEKKFGTLLNSFEKNKGAGPSSGYFG
ncbi:MAG: hypothetical protein K2X86_05810, partial [Cytophagaceae bacterium]|nr:hypothetical protein [Cytophagaceae bacterium]